MVKSVRVNIGPKRISGNTHASIASATRAARARGKEIADDIQSIIDSIEGATPEALEAGLKPTFELSQKYVPVKTGDLKKSGYLEVRDKGGKIDAEIGYAKGGKPNYATLVHEFVDIPHTSPTRAKYLESAIDEDFFNIMPRILSFIRAKTGF